MLAVLMLTACESGLEGNAAAALIPALATASDCEDWRGFTGERRSLVASYLLWKEREAERLVRAYGPIRAFAEGIPDDRRRWLRDPPGEDDARRFARRLDEACSDATPDSDLILVSNFAFPHSNIGPEL